MGTHYQGSAEEIRALDAYIKLQRAADSINSRLAPTLANSGLTTTQFGVLEALFHLGPMCQRALGRKLLRSNGNITMVVDNLEKRGLVQRTRDGEDRRFINVSLTPTGRSTIETLLPKHVKTIVDEFSCLQPIDLEQLGRICRQLGLHAQQKAQE